MAVITNPADHEIMKRFGLTEEQWETMQDAAYQVVTELVSREFPPLLANLTLLYACHLGAAACGMSKMAMDSLAGENGKIMNDAARWHFDEVQRSQETHDDDPGASTYAH